MQRVLNLRVIEEVITSDIVNARWSAWIGMYIKRPMSQWTLPGVLPNNPQVAGYAISYSGLEFVTVKGVGHMVPQWQRPAAYKMIYSFLNGTHIVHS